MWRRQNIDSGQDLVEYAIVFPVLMLMLLGIFEFGRIIYSYNAISNAAREGARLAILPAPENRANLDEAVSLGPTPCPSANPIIQRVCDRALALPGSLIVTVSQPNAVTVHFEVAYDGPFLTNLLLETINPAGLILRAASTMRLE
jgi:Flp pilus assembly protein TadG